MTLTSMAIVAAAAGVAEGGLVLALRYAVAGRVSGWPRCKLAHALLWEYSYKRLELAQLLGQLGVFLACPPPSVFVSLSRLYGGCVVVRKTPHRAYYR